jgi:hypothetical protein
LHHLLIGGRCNLADEDEFLIILAKVDTMKKLNCWEYMKCERQPGGKMEGALGICSVTLNEDLDGAHGGIGAGRACWAVVGTFCGGTVQGTYAQKLKDCTKCDFMALVRREESLDPLGFSTTRSDIEKNIRRKSGTPLRNGPLSRTIRS